MVRAPEASGTIRRDALQMALAYTVTARFEDHEVAEEFVHWLRHGHMQDVMNGGADRAEVVRWSEPPEERHTVTVRYRFPDRTTFDEYLDAHAPILQEEGIERFPPSRGVSFSRTIGVIMLPEPV